jgi:hypothetical protein
MELIALFQDSKTQIIDELKIDHELYILAKENGIDFAGEILPLRVHPNVDFFEPPAYWSKLKAEFKVLVCKRGDAYSKVYEELDKVSVKIDTWFLPIITSAIALRLGIEVAILSPFIRLLVVTSARLGVGAYCRDGIDGNLKLED